MSRDAACSPRGRLGLLLLAVVTAGAVLAAPALPAAADACDGVWVVVDASELGAGVQTRCAPGDPSSGLDALEGAGFTYTFVPRYDGMVCTIDGRPDPCNGAPPSAYWSYWNAEPGGAWRYSSTGAGSRDPAPGDVEGWAFGAGDPPSQPPPAPPAEEPADDGDDEDGSAGGGSQDDSGGSRDDASPQPSEDDGTSGGTAASGDSPTTSTSSGDADESSPSPDPDASGAGDEAGTTTAEDEDADDEEQQPDGDDARSDEASTDDDGTDDRQRTDLVERSSDDPADPDDGVAVDAGRGGGAGLVGVGVGAALVAAIAGAAVLRVRRSPGLDADA